MLRVTPRSAKDSDKRNQLVVWWMSCFFELIKRMTKLLPTSPKAVKIQLRIGTHEGPNIVYGETLKVSERFLVSFSFLLLKFFFLSLSLSLLAFSLKAIERREALNAWILARKARTRY